MRIYRSIDEMHAACRNLSSEGKSLGFVPTMGALHEGHLSLLRAARGRSNVVAVSIFVNPLQFGPQEDYAKYPRNFERDRQMLEAEGVALLFAPAAEEMYPKGSTTLVSVEGLSERLCGVSRPGHFRGVATVVAKLFNIVEPDFAFFGQKDAAQCALIRRMVRDLNLDVEIIVCPTVRERDGLAISSRNAYLEPQERKSATVLYRALARIQLLADRGERRASALLAAAHEVLAEEPQVKPDYLEIVDGENLQPVGDISQGALVAVAAIIGNTRLIDNIVLHGAGIGTGPTL